jgi:hypothetical protein
MTKFEEFKQEFAEKFDSIYDYIENFNKEPFNGKLIENNDMYKYDSYGNEESDLERIIYFEKYDINVMFSGTRCSYEGEEWSNMKEVKQTQKTITVWQ